MPSPQEPVDPHTRETQYSNVNKTGFIGTTWPDCLCKGGMSAVHFNFSYFVAHLIFNNI